MVSVQHHVAAFGGSTLEENGVNRLYRLAQDAVVAHEPVENFNIGGEAQSAATALDFGDVASARNGVRVVGTYSQGVAEIPERLDRCAVVRPALELIGTVGHQEMPVISVERRHRCPALARLLIVYLSSQDLGTKPLPFELIGEHREPRLQRIGTHEIEPFDTAARGLGSRE